MGFVKQFLKRREIFLPFEDRMPQRGPVEHMMNLTSD
jgi:hypothetical protein